MASSRLGRSIRNISWSVGTQLVVMLLGFAVRTTLVLSLGLTYVGLDTALLSLIALLTLAEAGMGASVMYSLYRPIQEGDTERIKALVTFSRTMFTWVAAVMATTGLLLLPVLDWLMATNAPDPRVKLYFLILLVGACSKYLFMHRSLVVIADQRFYLTKICNLAVQVVRSGLQILTLLFWESYLAFVVIYAAGSIVYALSLHVMSARYYPYLKSSGHSLPRHERRELFASVRAMFGYRAAVRVLTNSTPIFVVAMLGPSVGGAYANYLLIVASGLVILDLCFQAITASIGNLSVSSEKRKVREVFDELCVLTYSIYGLVGIVLLGTLEGIIVIWLGVEATLGPGAVFLIVLNFLAYGAMAPVMTMREATGQFRQVKWVLPVTAVLSVLLALFLGTTWGLLGLLAAPPLARLMLSNWLEPLLLIRMTLGGGFIPYVWRQVQFYTAVIGGTVLWLGVRGLSNWGSPSQLVYEAIILSGIGFLAFLAMYAGTREGRRLLVRLRGTSG